MYTQGRKRMMLDGFAQFMNSIFLMSEEDTTKVFNAGMSQDFVDLGMEYSKSFICKLLQP